MAWEGISIARLTRALVGEVKKKGVSREPPPVAAEAAAARVSNSFSMGFPASTSEDLTLQYPLRALTFAPWPSTFTFRVWQLPGGESAGAYRSRWYSFCWR